MTKDGQKQEKRRLQVTVICEPQLSDSITDYLVGVWDGGVEMGVEDNPVKQTLHAFFELEISDKSEIDGIVEQISSYCMEMAGIFRADIPQVAAQIIYDEDWASNWKKHFRPFPIIPGLVIKPTWEDYSPVEGEAVIEMDPGMAFGTGHHETTSLCMEFIRSSVEAQEGGKVLDIGTGTGILAMAAALFGARDVTAIDNDPEAVAAADLNVRHNGLQEFIKVDICPLESLEGEYSLVVANIIHDVLVAMEPDISRLTCQGGTLVLSGILKEDQADRIAALYEKAGFQLMDRQEKGEWAALRLVRGWEL